jgi:hypothetical protein
MPRYESGPPHISQCPYCKGLYVSLEGHECPQKEEWLGFFEHFKPKGWSDDE